MSAPRGQVGQALVGVLLVTALVGIVSAAVMNLRDHLGRENAFAEAKAGQTFLKEDIHHALQTRATCLATLTTAGLSGPVRLKWSAPAELAGAMDLPAYRLRVDALALVNTARVGAINATRDLYATEVELRARAASGTVTFKPVIATKLFLEVEGGAIVDCYGRSEVTFAARALCAAAGASFVNGRCLLAPRLPGVSCADGHYLQSFTTTGETVCPALPDHGLAELGAKAPGIAGTGGTARPTPGHWVYDGPMVFTGGTGPCPLTAFTAATAAQMSALPCSPIGTECAITNATSRFQQQNFTCR